MAGKLWRPCQWTVHSIPQDILGQNQGYQPILLHVLVYDKAVLEHSLGSLAIYSLRWRHNERDSVSNHQPRDCLLNGLFRRRSKKTSKLRVTGLCAGNSPGSVNSPHKGPVTQKVFPFDDVIMFSMWLDLGPRWDRQFHWHFPLATMRWSGTFSSYLQKMHWSQSICGVFAP